METNNNITDELIAKYICGNTTEEEESLIHEYLARNPEFADELLDIATALRQQQKKDDEAQCIDEQPKEAKRVFIANRRTFYAVAASIVLLIGIGFLVFRPFSNKDQGQSPVLVNSQETTKTDTIVNDTISNLEPVSNSSINQQVPLLVENQESSVQSSENATNGIIEQQLIADNAGSQPQETNTSANSEKPIVASMNVHENNSDAPFKADAIFHTDIPAVCNPDSELILNWNCNAPKLVLNISYGEGKSWEKTYDQSIHQEKLGPQRLQGFKIYSPQGINWKMTAYYSDGTLTEEGFIKFSN